MPFNIGMSHFKIYLFIFVFVTSAYFFQGGNPNTNSRFNLSRALSEDNSVQIDKFAPNTVDKAYREGHYYSDKSPGVAFLGAVILKLSQPTIKLLFDTPRGQANAELFLITILLLSLTTALVSTLFFDLCLFYFGKKHQGLAFSLSIITFSATLMFPYSTILFSHQLAANTLFLIYFYLGFLGPSPITKLKNWQLMSLAGLIAFAPLIEYPLGIPAIVGYLFLVKASWSKLNWRIFIPGVLVSIVFLGYNYEAFGSPFSIGYSNLGGTPFQTAMSEGVFGIKLPQWDRIFHLLFSGYRGLFYYCPILLFALWGPVSRLMNGVTYRRPAIVILLTFIYFVLINASYNFWQGGACFGPRHIVPAIFILSVGLLLLKKSWFFSPIFWLSTFISWIFMFIATSVALMPPEKISNPFLEYILPNFRSGRLAFVKFPILAGESFIADLQDRISASFNLGQLVFGLTGLSSLAPLILVQIGVLGVVGFKIMPDYLTSFLKSIQSKKIRLNKENFFELILFSAFIFLVLAAMYANFDMHSKFAFFRPIIDPFDVDRYLQIGRWSTININPFSDLTIEYPSLIVFVFGIFALLTTTLEYFFIVNCVAQMSLLAIFVKTLWNKLNDVERWFLFITLCLPSIIYFGINRFDLLISIGIGITVYLIKQQRPHLVGLTIAILGFIKWVPLLFVPWIFYYFLLQKTQHKNKSAIQFAYSFLSAALLILMLFYVFWGIESLTVPFLAQIQREPNAGSLPQLIFSLLPLTKEEILHKIILNGLLIFQFSGAGLVLLFQPKSFTRFLLGLIFITHSFIFFSKILSPQWLVWDVFVFYFLIFELIKEKRMSYGYLISFILPNIVAYIYFYICFGILNPLSDSGILISTVVTVFHGILLIFIMRKFRSEVGSLAPRPG